MSRPRAILLVGPIGAGKSRLVERIAAELRAAGRAVAGFVQRGVFAEGGAKIGYDLAGLASGAVRPLARRSAAGDRWEFYDAAFGSALGELRDGAELTVIDELGHLELAGGGHAPAIERALAAGGTLLVVVRDGLADAAGRLLGARAEVSRVRLEPGSEDGAATAVRELLRR